jgi:hypothetical protein
MKKIFMRTIAGLFLLTGLFTNTFAQAPDSVVIRVGKESKVVFLIKDKQDLETLKHYNFQALMDDMVQKLEKRDTTALTRSTRDYLKDSTDSVVSSTNWDWTRDRDEDRDEREHRSRRRERRTHHSFNIDLGMNNYLENGNFPDATNELYSVKPWGSWYVGLNSVLRTHVGGKFFMEWGAGVSWYNFKFENSSVAISEDANGVVFAEDPRPFDFTKSKLTACYFNASIIPVLDFGSRRRHRSFWDGEHSNSFRIGFGPYAAYRVDSYTKQVYFEGGEKHKSHNHDSFYLNNMRYGLRLQLGFRGTDIFFNYDMNELFTEGKGPKLQAFSFGITL